MSLPVALSIAATLAAGGDGGPVFPVISQVGPAVVGDSFTLQMENTSFIAGIEQYLISATLQPTPIPLGGVGTLELGLPVIVAVPGDPSQITTIGLPASDALIGFPLHIQGVGLVVEGATGQVKLSNLVTVVPDPPAPTGFSYSENPALYLTGVPITDNVATVQYAESFSVAPALPQGLVLDTDTGTISGTPTEIVPLTDYVVTASNVTGTLDETLAIAVDPSAPTTFEYADNPVTYVAGTPIADNTPMVDGFVDSFTVDPPLPDGLTLDPVTGVISGTPTSMSAQSSFTVTASNVTGFVDVELLITVDPAAPSNLSYDLELALYPANVPITPNNPTVDAEIVSIWEVDPALPQGLALNPATGVISGTPTLAGVGAGLQSYLVTASNVTGSDSVVLDIIIDSLTPPVLTQTAGGAPGADIEYQFTGTTDVGITEILAIDSEVFEPQYTPTLGIVFLQMGSPTYQEIEGDGSGTFSFPVANDPLLIGTTYYAQATGFVFNPALLFGELRISNLVETLITLPAPTSLTYPVSSATYFVDEPIDTLVPTVDGFVDTWEVNPPLPAGLTLDPGNGEISGTPTASAATADYTVTASNPAGGTDFVLTLRVLDGPLPQFGFMVNQTDATLSTFTVDSETGQLRHLGFADTGDAPSAVVVTPDGRFVYTADAASNNISGFEIDPVTGALTSTGSAIAGLIPDGLAVDGTGSYLYVTCTGSPADGVFAFEIDDVTGALTQVPGVSFGGGTLPNDIALFGNVVLTCSANGIDTIDSYLIDGFTGALTPVDSLPAGASPRGVEFSADGQYAYVANLVSDDVSGFSVSPTGVLAELSQSPYDVSAGGGDGPEDVDTSRKGFVYTANLTNGTVSGFSIAMDGNLNTLGPATAAGTDTFAVTVDPQGLFLYALNQGDDEVEIFDIGPVGGLSPASPVSVVRTRRAPIALEFNEALFPLRYVSDRAYVVAEGENRVFPYTLDGLSGALTGLGAGAPTVPLPAGVTVHPAQDFLYVTALSSQVGTYEVLGDGTLAGIPPAEPTGQGPWSTMWEPSGRWAYTTLANPSGGIQQLVRQPDGTVSAGGTSGAGAQSRRGAMHPNGRFLYVPNQGDDSITKYEIVPFAGGALVQAQTTGTGIEPVQVAVDPTGRFAYAVNSSDAILSQYTIDSVTGNLTANGTVPVVGSGAVSLAVEPSGRFLYVAFEDSDQISIFSINGVTGVASELGAISPVNTDLQPVFLVVDSSGRFLYAVNRGAENVRVYQIDQVTGALFAGATTNTGVAPREMSITREFDLTTE